MGWNFEPSDPTVGIFGEAWFHDCGTEDAALEALLCELNRPHGEADFYVMLTCEDCAVQRLVLLRDYTGWNEAADYNFWDRPVHVY